ncbi:MAG: chemotaxis protein MotB [Planctomycetota bacterium]|jgi:chemotaxis protein MotB
MGKTEEEPPMIGAPLWITTFVDMTSLLVTFFILLFTFSSIEDNDTFTFKKNFIGTSGHAPESGADAVEPPNHDRMAAMDVSRGSKVPHSRPPEELFENLEEMGQTAKENEIEFDPKDVRDGLVMVFNAQASFKPGSAEVTPALRRRLQGLGDVLSHYQNQVVIEGHTDSEFKASSRYPNAESLAAARASNAAKVLVGVTDFPASMIQIAGLGSLDPRVPGDTAADRTLNRRVEIQILSVDASVAAAQKDRGF